MSGRGSPRLDVPRYSGHIDPSPAVVWRVDKAEEAQDDEENPLNRDCMQLVLHASTVHADQRPPPPPPTGAMDISSKPIYWQLAFIVQDFSGDTLRRPHCPLAVHARLCLFFVAAFRWACPNNVSFAAPLCAVGGSRPAHCR